MIIAHLEWYFRFTRAQHSNFMVMSTKTYDTNVIIQQNRRRRIFRFHDLVEENKMPKSKIATITIGSIQFHLRNDENDIIWSDVCTNFSYIILVLPCHLGGT